MTKAELLSQLENAKNNYILGLAAISLFSSPKAYPILEHNRATFGTYSIEFGQIVSLLRKDADREIAIREFLTSQIRAVIKESFELIKDYCHHTGQEPVFRAAPWYHFARMIRNCLSHNFKFKFAGHDRTLLPVSWGSRKITVSEDGQPLRLDFFGYVETWELFQAYQSFVDNDLI